MQGLALPTVIFSWTSSCRLLSVRTPPLNRRTTCNTSTLSPIASLLLLIRKISEYILWTATEDRTLRSRMAILPGQIHWQRIILQGSEEGCRRVSLPSAPATAGNSETATSAADGTFTRPAAPTESSAPVPARRRGHDG